jgi:hypothetical protein
VVVAVGQDHQPRLPGEVLAVSGFGVKWDGRVLKEARVVTFEPGHSSGGQPG